MRHTDTSLEPIPCTSSCHFETTQQWVWSLTFDIVWWMPCDRYMTADTSVADHGYVCNGRWMYCLWVLNISFGRWINRVEMSLHHWMDSNNNNNVMFTSFALWWTNTITMKYTHLNNVTWLLNNLIGTLYLQYYSFVSSPVLAIVEEVELGMRLHRHMHMQFL